MTSNPILVRPQLSGACRSQKYDGRQYKTKMLDCIHSMIKTRRAQKRTLFSKRPSLTWKRFLIGVQFESDTGNQKQLIITRLQQAYIRGGGERTTRRGRRKAGGRSLFAFFLPSRRLGTVTRSYIITCVTLLPPFITAMHHWRLDSWSRSSHCGGGGGYRPAWSATRWPCTSLTLNSCHLWKTRQNNKFHEKKNQWHQFNSNLIW